jgi:hypothetical protein
VTGGYEYTELEVHFHLSFPYMLGCPGRCFPRDTLSQQPTFPVTPNLTRVGNFRANCAQWLEMGLGHASCHVSTSWLTKRLGIDASTTERAFRGR